MSLAGSDGRVVGGGVAGTMEAATPVQVLIYLHNLISCFYVIFVEKGSNI